MPLYDYKCTKCGKISEVRHGFNEGHDEPCPACGGIMTRVFNPAPIVFKGSGFYVTDSRKSRAGNATASTETPSAADAAPKADSPKTDKPSPPKEPTTAKSGEAKSVSTNGPAA